MIQLYSQLLLEPIAEEVKVNGHKISKPVLLRNGYRILFGANHLFRLQCPVVEQAPDEGGLYIADVLFNAI